MAKAKTRRLVEDLILSCASDKVPSETAQKAVRAICRYFGGQMIYIPGKKADGASAESLRGVIADAVGDGYAEKILAKIMILYGCTLLYIPLEGKAFRKTIAREIYERLGKDGTTMPDLARDYRISVAHGYRLWEEGQDEKFRPSMPYLPFLEMPEYNKNN
jgi:Mor family transcriptional regulator